MLLGCIADDFTGATDLANMLVGGGMRCMQTIGVPQGSAPDADAVVVALKSRTIPAAEAVAQSLAALDWLKRAGYRQFYFKYCSTFDSTPQGNIGPVAEALMDALGANIAIACPAFPCPRPSSRTRDRSCYWVVLRTTSPARPTLRTCSWEGACAASRPSACRRDPHPTPMPWWSRR